MTHEQLKEKALGLPLTPGVYIMLDRSGEVIYVGKAKALKNRVVSYFRDTNQSPKTMVMVSKVDSFDVIMVRNEFEALITENQLIKLHKPKYNILLKDDKGFPYLRVDMREAYPKFEVAAKTAPDGARYLGPYGGRQTVWKAIDSVTRALKLPSCSRKFPAEIGKGRPCLNKDMGICRGWCTGSPDGEEYGRVIKQAILILEGKIGELSEQLQAQMEEAAENLQFEIAADLRDKLRAVKSLGEKQLAVSGAMADTDAVGFYRGAAKCCFVVLHYIGGKLLDKDFELLESPMEEDAEAVSALVRQYYMSRGLCPKNILLPLDIEDMESLEQLLSDTYGSKVYITAPKRGDKRLLTETANMNAREENERATDREERVSGILKWLQNAASLKVLPKRIEAYDISNLGNEDAVGSMTVFADTKPLKRDYRRFKIKTVEGADDYGSMREVITRRLNNYFEGDEKFNKLPDLLLIDGGSVHASTVRDIVEGFGLDIPVLGMVKDDRHRTRALTLPDGGEIGIEAVPAVFSFIGRIQEETHRFAIEYQRKLREKKLTSRLDEIKGVGEVGRNKLLKHFKTIKAIEAASLEELSKVVPKNTARAVYEHYHEKEE
jgi:excinuclease ABC subunit C